MTQPSSRNETWFGPSKRFLSTLPVVTESGSLTFAGAVALLARKPYDASGESTPETPPPAKTPAESRAKVTPAAVPETRMKYENSSEQFQRLFGVALRMARSMEVDAIVLLPESAMDWQELKEQADGFKIVVAAESPRQLAAAQQAGFSGIHLGLEARPVYEQLSMALLNCVANDALRPGSRVVAMYAGFDADTVDSISVIDLGDHLERLSSSDLQKLEMRVPLDTLKKVVDLALEIGREGREGKPVGTIFVVGDHRKVLEHSRSAGFDPVRGYSRRERNLHDRRVREGIKEIAQLDGAFIITSDGTVAAACRILDAPTTDIALSKGLGARHWAAAAISSVTKAVAVAVSESSGTVRIFQNGELVLRIEPFRRPMKWKDFQYEPPASE